MTILHGGQLVYPVVIVDGWKQLSVDIMNGIVIVVALCHHIESNKMSKRVIKKQHNEEYVEAIREDLRRLQYWFDGFEASGGKLPQCLRGLSSLNATGLSSLNAAIRILHDYKVIK
jgi:hypothetical protein